MKKIGEYTVLGTVAVGATKKIALFDGRFDTGYRIKSISFVSQQPRTQDVYGVVTTEDDGVVENWNYDDSTQVAWGAYVCWDTNVLSSLNDVDPDNLIIEDLYVHANSNNGGIMNYKIVLEKYSFSDWRGALAMVRNRSQT